MEMMAARYDEQARDAGIYLVSACGFDCIPNDMGALLLQRSFNGELAYMESYMSVSRGVSWVVVFVLFLFIYLFIYIYLFIFAFFVCLF